MKKFLAVAFAALLLISCGVGKYTVSSGKADECAISFTSSPKKANIVVTVDGQTYRIQSVAEKRYKVDRRIKETSENTIVLAPGTHDVQVEKDGQVVYSKKLYISASEHKVVNL